MTHIDEGTIHAWLDDALAPDEAARVEEHVRDCTECAAAVAEARGFIAASSRILSALDHVPGGVIPRTSGDAVGAGNLVVVQGGAASVDRTAANAGAGADDAGVAAASVGDRGAGDGGAALPRSRRQRPWWQRPRFAAAAGIAFIAVTLSVVARRGGVGNVADHSMERTPASQAPQGAAPADSVGETKPAPSLAADAVAPGETARRAPAAAKVAPADVAPAGVAPAGNAPAAPLRTPVQAPASTPVAAIAPSVAGGTTRAADSTVAERKLAVSADAITRAEKARVAGEREVQMQNVVTTGAAVARSEERGDLTTVAGIVGCYRLQRRVPALDAGVSELIALDATESGTFEGDVLRIARLIDVPPVANTQWRWTLSPRGDVALVRVQGEAHARFPLALRLAAQTGETTVATRVACPSR